MQVYKEDKAKLFTENVVHYRTLFIYSAFEYIK